MKAMKHNLFKTKSATVFAFLQYLTGVGLTILLIFNVVPKENEKLLEILITAVVVSALKDAGPWMYEQVKDNNQSNNESPQNQ